MWEDGGSNSPSYPIRFLALRRAPQLARPASARRVIDEVDISPQNAVGLESEGLDPDDATAIVPEKGDGAVVGDPALGLLAMTGSLEDAAVLLEAIAVHPRAADVGELRQPFALSAPDRGRSSAQDAEQKQG
jgi:hypothetical protein